MSGRLTTTSGAKKTNISHQTPVASILGSSTLGKYAPATTSGHDGEMIPIAPSHCVSTTLLR
jgi:hypothetical protein